MRPPHRFLHVCQAWIIPGEKICGAPAMPGVSWCEAHPDPLGVEAQERAWDEAARAAAEGPRGEGAGEQLGLFGGGS